jgi:CheY-like chemotaxis protein
VAHGEPFDLALIDMMMPAMDGETLGKAIRGDPALALMRCVLLTSSPQRGDSERMRRAGFDAYLTKPIKKELLRRCLSALRAGAPTERQTQPILTRFTIEQAKRGEGRILLVEDNPINQKVATVMLAKLGHRVDLALNGQEALEALAQKTYGLVLMDCQMPVMDGFEATRRIRAGATGDTNRNIPIIAMTANAMVSDHEHCLAEGMNDYLAKPVSKDELSAKVSLWLASNSGSAEPGTATAAPPQPPSLQPATPALFDVDRLIANCAYDREFAREIVISVLEELPKQFDLLENLLAAADWRAAERVAHTMKGLAAQVGGVALPGRLLEFEHLLRAGQPTDPAILAAIRAEYGELAKQLGDWLAV